MPLLAVPPPNPWAVTLDRVNALGPALLAARGDLTPAAQAAAIGIGLTTLTGLTTGATNPTKSTIVAALAWLAQQ